ncbi:MAG TPA: DUF1326 domain-containing protein [Longimicrobiales bacterium]|nr:DUF1326 domain-containing protein [Longimicrobiales bacterium]
MATQTAQRPAYRIKMNHLEACSCQHGCNSQFGGYPNEGYCEFMIAYDLIEGSYGDVDLAGTRVAVLLAYPNALHEGNGRGVRFVDERASDEQAAALEEIWTGRAGGMPWEALAGTLTSHEGPVRKPIEIELNGPRSSFRVPGALSVELTPLINPVTGGEKEVEIRYPKGGFFWNSALCTTTATMQADYGGIRFSHPGKFASVTGAEWTNRA